jgi:ATP-binding cassette, subfamily B, bacterial
MRDALTLYWNAAGAWMFVPFVLSILGGFAPVIGASLTRKLVNELAATSRPATEHLAELAIAIGLIGAFLPASSYARAYISAMCKHRVMVFSTTELFSRLSRFTGLARLEDPTFRDRLVLAEQAAQAGPDAIVSSTQQLLQTGIVIVGFLGTLFVLSPWMASLLLLIAVPTLLVQLARARKLAETTELMTPTQRRSIFYKSLMLDIRAAKEMRLFGFSSLMAERYSAAIDDAGSAPLRLERRTAFLQSALAILAALVTTVGLVLIVAGVANGSVSLGTLTLFIAATAGVQASLGGVVFSISLLSWATRTFPNYRDVIKAPDDLLAGTRQVRPLTTGLEFDNVWFRYDETSSWALKGISLEIPAKTTVGIIGLNGAGKSTLIKLLCRFYDPARGAIRWDGVDLREFDPDELRKRIAATFQDFHCYDLTAIENIGFGSLKHRDDVERVRRAADRAGIASTIEALPRGYATLLSRIFQDEEGEQVTLSGGQWQRIAIARSFMRERADLLILDEPSSGLDARAEHEIAAMLRDWRRDRTSIVVTHRLGAMRDVDHIFLLADGEIVESGTHESLIDENGVYAELFELQAASYRDSSFDKSRST